MASATLSSLGAASALTGAELAYVVQSGADKRTTTQEIAALAFAAAATVASLTAASALDGTELFYGVQGGADRKVTADQIKTWANTSPTHVGLTTLTVGASNTGVIASTGYSLTGSDATNMIDLAGTWNTSGVPTIIKANITNTTVGSGAKFFDFQLGGSSRAVLTSPNAATSGNYQLRMHGNNGNAYTYVAMFMDSGGEGGGFTGYTNSVGQQFVLVTSAVTNGARLALGALGQITFQSVNRTDSGSIDTVITRAAAGVVQFGTSSTPNQNGAARMDQLHLTDGITAPSATVGQAKVYVDTSDGDLKVIFGDGTIKTIVADT